MAENVTFAVIGPHEYELPVNYKDFDAFVQYGFANPTTQTYGANGGLNKMPNQDFNVGLTKFVRFISFDSLPDIGFAPEAIIPEINLNSGGGPINTESATPSLGVPPGSSPTKIRRSAFRACLRRPVLLTASV